MERGSAIGLAVAVSIVLVVVNESKACAVIGQLPTVP